MITSKSDKGVVKNDQVSNKDILNRLDTLTELVINNNKKNDNRLDRIEKEVVGIKNEVIGLKKKFGHIQESEIRKKIEDYLENILQNHTVEEKDNSPKLSHFDIQEKIEPVIEFLKNPKTMNDMENFLFDLIKKRVFEEIDDEMKLGEKESINSQVKEMEKKRKKMKDSIYSELEKMEKGNCSLKKKIYYLLSKYELGLKNWFDIFYGIDKNGNERKAAFVDCNGPGFNRLITCCGIIEKDINPFRREFQYDIRGSSQLVLKDNKFNPSTITIGEIKTTLNDDSMQKAKKQIVIFSSILYYFTVILKKQGNCEIKDLKTIE